MRKKKNKLFIILIIFILLFITIDTLQSKAFNNKPILVIHKYIRHSYIKYEGIFVETYCSRIDVNKEDKTYFKWELREF